MSTMQLPLFESSRVQAPEKLGRAEIRSVDANSILSPAKGKIDGWFDFSLNPYRGCGFGCTYCYAAFFVPDDVQRAEWGKWVEVKANALERLSRNHDLGGKRILMSSVTDPYQPVEQRTKLTRSLLEHLAERREQPELTIQTRGPLVTRDIDVLGQFKKLRLNVSITTDSDDIRRRFEPHCASIERRLDAVRELAAAGFDVWVAIAPMLPMRNPDEFAKKILDAGASGVWTSYFHSADRLFASSTGEAARLIAREMGWNRDAFRRQRDALGRYIPRLAA